MAHSFHQVSYLVVPDCPQNCEKCSNRFSCCACDKGYAPLKRFNMSRCVQNCPRGCKKNSITRRREPVRERVPSSELWILSLTMRTNRPNRCERCKPYYLKLTVGDETWQQHDFYFSHVPPVIEKVTRMVFLNE